MISKFDLAKALRDHAKLVAISEGITLISIDDPEGYNPDPNTPYLEEMVLFGPDRPIGIADASRDLQVGVYQININRPKTEAKWVGLRLADTISIAFKKGTELTYNGQMVRMREQELRPMLVNATHKTFILSIVFTVIN